MTLATLTPAPTLITQAHGAILEAICDGRLLPGERLNQDGLAATLSISRQPVGQALSILKSQGFVRDTGRRGLIVAPLERGFFAAIYELREALDPMAVRLAAARCTKEDLAEGRRLLQEGRRALSAGAIAGLIAADMSFHMWIYRTGGNPLVVETMGLYWNHLRRAMAEVLRHAPQRKRVWDEHEQMLKALEAGKGGEAARWALRHVEGAAQRVAASIPELAGAPAKAKRSGR